MLSPSSPCRPTRPDWACKHTMCASTNGRYPTLNTATCCAERNLLKELQRSASRKGVNRHALRWWMHRKCKVVCVERYTADGRPGCSLPCVDYRAALSAHSMKTLCHDRAGNMVRVRCSDLPDNAMVCASQRSRRGLPRQYNR